MINDLYVWTNLIDFEWINLNLKHWLKIWPQKQIEWTWTHHNCHMQQRLHVVWKGGQTLLQNLRRYRLKWITVEQKTPLLIFSIPWANMSALHMLYIIISEHYGRVSVNLFSCRSCILFGRPARHYGWNNLLLPAGTCQDKLVASDYTAEWFIEVLSNRMMIRILL